MKLNNDNINDKIIIEKMINLDLNFPSDLLVSTLTVTCNINKYVNLANLFNNIELDSSGIIYAKFCNKKKILETCKFAVEYDKKKMKKKNFYNQLTMHMNLKENKYVNFKIFKNGTIHFTGCKSNEDCNIAMNKLVEKIDKNQTNFDIAYRNVFEKIKDIRNNMVKLKKIYETKSKFEEHHSDKTNQISIFENIHKFIYNDSKNKTKKQILEIMNNIKKENVIDKVIHNMNITKFIKESNDFFNKIDNEINKFKKIKINNVQIRMINTNFGLSYKICRNRIYTLFGERNLLIKPNQINKKNQGNNDTNHSLHCIYESLNYAGVKIIICKNNTKVYIFLFESGKITLIGNNKTDITKAYELIKSFLDYNKKRIIKLTL